MPAFTVTDRLEAAREIYSDGDSALMAFALKTIIRDGMDLLENYRVSGRLDYTAFPPSAPDILTPAGPGRGDDVWEGSMKWTNPTVPEGTEVHRLDTNAAYLSATNTQLPLGQLVHEFGSVFEPNRSGLYLITPPEWHVRELPNPLGQREEPGQLWVCRPTLQLLLDCSQKWSLCDEPQIHESWTSGSTDAVFRKWREAVRDARTAAIASGDQLAELYIKAMYSQTISTLDGKKNRHIRRRDWRHIIHSQAFSNLWRKAFKADSAGLTVYRAMGTDELHVVGDWRAAVITVKSKTGTRYVPAFPEGRGLAEMKLKPVIDRETGLSDGGTYLAAAEKGRR